MKGRIFSYDFLTHAEKWQGFSLTFALLFILLTRASHADMLPALEARQQDLDKQHISQVTSYLRSQLLQGASRLPSEIRSSFGWFNGSWHAVHTSADDVGHSSAFVPSVDADDGEMNMVTNFHHKGFLPMHDAMMIGASFKQNLVAGKLDLTARPFVGQSWNSLRNYRGVEMALNVVKKADDLPWGKISLGYVGGNDTLTDHGTGIDLHGDVDLTQGWKLTSGIRQDNATGDSNYLMIRWKMSFE